MKKYILILIFVLYSASPTFAVEIYNDVMYIPYTDVLPVIDGQMDRFWYNIGEIQMTQFVVSSEYGSTMPENDRDCHASFKICYGCTAFYLFIKIVDDQLEVGETVIEKNDFININFDYFKDMCCNSECRWFFYYGDTTAAIASYPWILNRSSWVKTENGYQCEIMIEFTEITSLKWLGAEAYGFELAFADRDNGEIEHVLQWWSDQFYPIASETWGQVEFLNPYFRTVTNNLELFYKTDDIEVDGVMEELWWHERTADISMNHMIIAPGIVQQNWQDLFFTCYINWYLRYDSGADLNFMIQVFDDQIDTSSASVDNWDGIEIFIDGNNNNNDMNLGLDERDRHFQFGYGQRYELNQELSVEQIAWKKTEGGYQVELKLDWDDLYPIIGEYFEPLSMEIQVNDWDDGQLQAIGQWVGSSQTIDEKPSQFITCDFIEEYADPWTPCAYKTDAIANEVPSIQTFTLSPNYPNPFNPYTTINYSLSSPSHVSLRIFDVKGRELEHVLNEYQGQGNHQVVFDARHLPSGMYVYELKAGVQVERRKMMLVR